MVDCSFILCGIGPDLKWLRDPPRESVPLRKVIVARVVARSTVVVKALSVVGTPVVGKGEVDITVEVAMTTEEMREEAMG